MKILFDHCVPKPLRRAFPAHQITTTAEMGWEDLKNGALLAEAAKAFDLLLTVDQNMKYEQNLKTLALPILVLVAPKNTPEALIGFAPFVERVLPLKPGQMIEIDSSGNVMEVAPPRS